MFIVRSIFWLSTVVMLLPPAEGGEPAPRISLLHTAYAARVLMQDMSGVCERNPDACAASREAVELLGRKLQTGAGIVAAGIRAGEGLGGESVDRGTLIATDLEPNWLLSDSTAAY